MTAEVRFRRAWFAVGVLGLLWSWQGDPWTPEWRVRPFGAPMQGLSIWVWILVDTRRPQICEAFRWAHRPRTIEVGFLAGRMLRAVGF